MTKIELTKEESTKTDTGLSSSLVLAETTIEDFCLAARGLKHNEFWWYMHGTAMVRGSTRPFQDRERRWWWCVKPGLAWPVDFFRVIEENELRRAPRRRLLGWQYPVVEAAANSVVRFNVIRDLAGYNLDRVAENKRRAVRKGLRELRIERTDPAQAPLSDEACEVWNSHVARTGWNRPLTAEVFARSWRELAGCPGTTVLVAREADKENRLCAWLIARVIDGTVYVDTIASHTDRVASRPNDALIFVCLRVAAAQGIRQAHYSLKSRILSLEDFKQSLGFEPIAFPAKLFLRRLVGWVLEKVRPSVMARLKGDEK